jgi:hypothetical protein
LKLLQQGKKIQKKKEDSDDDIDMKFLNDDEDFEMPADDDDELIEIKPAANSKNAKKEEVGPPAKKQESVKDSKAN